MTLFNRNDKSGDARQPPPQTPQQQAAQPSLAKLESAAPKPAEAKPAESRPAEPPLAVAIAKPSSISTPTPTKAGASMASVISKALKITGELESTEDIQIDGQIEGDVRGVGVKIGQNAKVKGTVYGDEVELAGTIEGRIESKKVILAGTARMTGDIWHQEIKIESGAYISGTLKPELGKGDGKPVHKPASVTATTSSASVSPASTGNATGAAHH
jgi:cytoskeletal protein CcmA (bactofilin family)